MEKFTAYTAKGEVLHLQARNGHAALRGARAWAGQVVILRVTSGWHDLDLAHTEMPVIQRNPDESRPAKTRATYEDLTAS